jgi:hypothetical protein
MNGIVALRVNSHLAVQSISITSPTVSLAMSRQSCAVHESEWGLQRKMDEL